MGSVEHRKRSSTLSRIGRILGVSEKPQVIHESEQETNDSNIEYQHHNSTKPDSISNPSSVKSFGSSNSSVTQSITDLDKQHRIQQQQQQQQQLQQQPQTKQNTLPRVTSRTSSRPPSRTPSLNYKTPGSSTTLADDLNNLKVSSGVTKKKQQAQQQPQQPSQSPQIPQQQHIDPNTVIKNSMNSASSTTVGSSISASNKLLSRSSSVTSNHHSGNLSATVTNPKDPKTLPRFVVYEDGSHAHHLRNAKRQEKLSNMLKNLLGAQKLRDEAVSAVPEILSNNPPSLFSGLVNQMSNSKDDGAPISGATRYPNHASIVNQQEPVGALQMKTFAQRYGRCQGVVGKGTFGVVRISHKKEKDKETLYAVKEFKKKPNETEQKYSRRLTSEFCISSSLKHVNIIETLDLLQDAKGDYVEVMEFCSGGDLYTLIIAAGKLEYLEADCFFKQLIRGVVYMHEMGVAHRDLKPENLLLTETGILKITDFGNGECFKMAWEDRVHFSGGICGSSPYIAPEEYNTKEFDPRSVDIWACGVIYMAMRTGRQLWRAANQDDEFYLRYLEGRKSAKGYEPIEHLKRARCRNVIYSILDPIPNRRINGKQILNSEWGREIRCCL